MAKFLLPFHEDHSRLGPFSPTAMVLSSFISAVMITIQTDLRMILVVIGMIAIGGTAARTNWRHVISLAARFEIAILFWIFFMPFLYGSTVIGTIATPWGSLNVYSEGIGFGLLLGSRMFALILLFVGTFSHLTLSGFIGALRTIRVPNTILGSLLIMLRYIPLFIEERKRMQDAQSLRGFERGTWSDRIRSLGSLVGSNIDRAFDRSISVYESMKLRGFGGRVTIKGAGFRRADIVLVFVLVLLGASLFVVFPIIFEAMLL